MRTTTLLLSLGALTGCFAEPGAVDTDGSSATDSPTTTSGPSSTAPTSSDNDDDDDTASSEADSTTFFDSSSTAVADETTFGCLGEEGCPCTDPVKPTCADKDLMCVEGVCVRVPFECVVSYGGGPEGVTFSSARIHNDGTIFDHSTLDIEGAHDPSPDVSGQDMLTTCNGFLYAVLQDDAQIATLRLLPDGSLEFLGLFPVPANGPQGERSLRALECAAPHAPALLAVSVISNPGIAPAQVVLHSLPIDEGGMLSADAPPIVFANMTDVASNRVRTAWSPEGRGFVMYDNPTGNNASLHSFDVQAQTGIASLGPTPPLFVGGIQGRVGGIETTPAGNVALVGAQQGTQQGVGESVLFEIGPDGSYDPAFSAIADADGETFHFEAKSIEFATAGDVGPQAYVGSIDSFAAMQFMGTPVIGPQIDFPGRGSTFVFPVHDGDFLVALNATVIRSFAAPKVPLDPAGEELDALSRELQSINAAVRMRCPTGDGAP